MSNYSFFRGLLTTQSLAGGTGSGSLFRMYSVHSLGFGSRLMEEVRIEFPKQYLISTVITPHMTGETPLQSYNACLALNSLQKSGQF
jgi:hypothetical protein